ncbi:coiled-coil domain-containing protein 63-like [Amia ocellicauda]|uniref:coiled-coil domain-containing protein 63-like n=1 Tax=Amia ocellicauda TaxID=2972642 RepID=UPI003463CB5E
MVKPNKKTISSKTEAGFSGKPSTGNRYSNNDADSDNEGENDLISLQRTYHKLEGQRKAEEKESQDTVRKQRDLIRQLDAERDEISIRLQGAGSRGKESQDHKMTVALKSLVEKSEDIDEQIADENKTLSTLEREIKEVQRKLEKERKANALKEDPSRKVRRLTDQLAQANGKFGSLLSSNSSLREEIQTMRGEKGKFQQLYNKLYVKVQENRIKSGEVLNEANEFYHTREEAQAKIIRVRDQQEKDVEQYNAEMREIRRELNHARKVKRFLQEKRKEREPDQEFLNAKEKLEAKENERRIEHKVTLNRYEDAVEKINEIIEKENKKKGMSRPRRGRVDNKRDEGSAEDDRRRLWETASRRKSTIVSPVFKEAVAEGDTERQGRRLTEHRRRSIVFLGEEQERLKELIRKSLDQREILEEKDFPDFDAELFFNVYVEREDLNFALFNYVTEQTSDIEDIEEDIEQLKLNIELQRDQDFLVSQEHKDIMKALEINLHDTTEASSRYKTDVEEYEKVLALVKTGVQELAVKAGVNTTSSEHSFGWTDGVTNENILTYLGVVEQKVGELLAVWSYQKYQAAERKDESAESVLAYLGLKAPADIPQCEVHLPSTSLLLDSDEESGPEDLKPLSKEELQQRAMKSIQVMQDGSKAKQGKTLQENSSHAHRRAKEQ